MNQPTPRRSSDLSGRRFNDQQVINSPSTSMSKDLNRALPKRIKSILPKRHFEQMIPENDNEQTEKETHQVPFSNLNRSNLNKLTDEMSKVESIDDVTKSKYELPESHEKRLSRPPSKEPHLSITNRELSKRLVKDLTSFLLFKPQ